MTIFLRCLSSKKVIFHFGLFEWKYCFKMSLWGGQLPSKCSQFQNCLNLIRIFQKCLKFKIFSIILRGWGGGWSLIGPMSQISLVLVLTPNWTAPFMEILLFWPKNLFKLLFSQTRLISIVSKPIKNSFHQNNFLKFQTWWVKYYVRS